MSFFEKLKKDIGISEEKEKTEKKKKKPAFSIEKTPPKREEESEVSVEKKKKPKKVPVSLPKKEAADWLKTEGQLAVDVYQMDSEFCIQAPIAGVEPEDIDVSVENEMLVIKGERKEPEQGKEKSYSYQECYWGPFSRQIILPEDVDPQRIKATLNKGILSIKIPRVRRVKKKKITIQAAD